MTTPRDSRPHGWPEGMPSTGPSGPSGQAHGGFDPGTMLHARCGRPAHQHPAGFHFGGSCPFPPLEPVEFAQHVEPTVRVCGIPDPSNIPPPVLNLLGDLARACRDAYGMGVEVEAGGEREAAVLALETIRRYLG